MVWRMKVRLPSLKVTQLSARIVVPRGRRGAVAGIGADTNTPVHETNECSPLSPEVYGSSVIAHKK